MGIKRFLKLLSVIAIFTSLAMPGATLAQTDVVRIAMSSAADAERSGVYVWLKAFKECLEESGFAVELFPNSALGGEQDRTEMMRLGLLQVNDSGSFEIKSFSPLFGSIALPFLFNNTRHFDRVIRETDFLDRVNAETAPQGIRVIDVALLGGMSGLFNTKAPVTSPEDMKGLRLRAMERTDLVILNAWGVPGTQVAWEEVPQALETGIAHGYFNAPMVPIIFGHTRQIRYFTDLRMTPATRVITVSESWLAGLQPQEKTRFDEAVLAGHEANRKWARAIQVREKTMLRAHGITVSDLSPKERERFAASVRVHYDRFLPRRYVDAAVKLARKFSKEQ